jgi:hypothetical protein
MGLVPERIVHPFRSFLPSHWRLTTGGQANGNRPAPPAIARPDMYQLNTYAQAHSTTLNLAMGRHGRLVDQAMEMWADRQRAQKDRGSLIQTIQDKGLKRTVGNRAMLAHRGRPAVHLLRGWRLYV